MLRQHRIIPREPNYGVAASETTRVALLYDRAHLYFAAVMHDREPERVVANVMRRAAELQDNDSFEIYLDTYHDHRNLFYFATNALGAQRDGLIRNEGESQNWDWDGVWESAGRRTATGWSAEIAIPLRTLRFKADSAQTWGANFARRIPRKREESYWAPVACDLGFFGHLKPAYYGHLEIKPFTLTGGVKDFEANEPFERKLDFGADTKVYLTADLTLNTDFAQVESGQEQVNLTCFDLFFPEKREFFLENADVFRVGERVLEVEPPSTLLFFSRSIGLTDNGEFYSGKPTSVVGGLLVGPNANLSFELNYTRNQVDLPTANGKYGTNLGLARVIYSFTPRLFAKVFAQYNSDDERFRLNLLVNWIHRPGSNLFLVYNKEQDTSGASWRGRNRTLLAKLNYLIGW